VVDCSLASHMVGMALVQHTLFQTLRRLPQGFQYRYERGWFAIIVAAISSFSAVEASGQDKPASNMRDVRAHFAHCIQLPHDADASLITFYFSLTRAGQVYGQPRLVLHAFNGGSESRKLFSADSLKAFNECLPIPLDEELATTIPGKVYFLQFNVRDSDEVVLKPYGSHGGSVAAPGLGRLEPWPWIGPGLGNHRSR
jgi:hypothetical protein